jgi:prepilin-type N-terminal cleavage/methylation domain-containing protein
MKGAQNGAKTLMRTILSLTVHAAFGTLASIIVHARMVPLQCRRSAFTLIELLLVIGIIAILAGIVITAINPKKQFASGNDAARLSDTKQLLNAFQQYNIDQGQYPDAQNIPEGKSNTLPVCANGKSYPGLCIDANALAPTYFVSVPHDPDEPCTAYSGFEAYTQNKWIQIEATNLHKSKDQIFDIDCPYIWTGGAGTTTWTDPNNWDRNGVKTAPPIPIDHAVVYIPAGKSAEFPVQTQDTTNSSFVVYGTLTWKDNSGFYYKNSDLTIGPTGIFSTPQTFTGWFRVSKVFITIHTSGILTAINFLLENQSQVNNWGEVNVGGGGGCFTSGGVTGLSMTDSLFDNKAKGTVWNSGNCSALRGISVLQNEAGGSITNINTAGHPVNNPPALIYAYDVSNVYNYGSWTPVWNPPQCQNGRSWSTADQRCE